LLDMVHPLWVFDIEYTYFTPGLFWAAADKLRGFAATYRAKGAGIFAPEHLISRVDNLGFVAEPIPEDFDPDTEVVPGRRYPGSGSG
jgi:hypothetical protein